MLFVYLLVNNVFNSNTMTRSPFFLFYGVLRDNGTERNLHEDLCALLCDNKNNV